MTENCPTDRELQLGWLQERMLSKVVSWGTPGCLPPMAGPCVVSRVLHPPACLFPLG